MPKRYLRTAALGAVALTFAVTQVIPARTAAASTESAATQPGDTVTADVGAGMGATSDSKPAASVVAGAVAAFREVARPLSHPRALEDAFRSYFAFRSAHPDRVKKPLLYFVDYGLPSTTPRGYVFNMETLEVVDGPFMVAHGRGSSATRDGVPTRFSNVLGSAQTSLGLYVAAELYSFTGKAAGQTYASVGLRLDGVSTGYNDNARIRRVVAHGAPYVTSNGAGRSEGCPALEPDRARRLLPQLADGGLVFLFAPDSEWLGRDRWITAFAE